jgi:cytochrome P450
MTGILETSPWPLDLYDPYPDYSDLRAIGPIHWLPALECHLVVSYEECRSALQRPEWSSDPRSSKAVVDRLGSNSGVLEVTGASLLTSDAPEHTRLRRSIGPFFSPSSVAALTPRIAAIVHAAVSSIDFSEPFDLMDEIAYPVPLAVMCELLNTGTELAALLRHETPRLVAILDPLANDETISTGVSAAFGLMLELVPLVAERKTSPGPDLLSTLAQSDHGLESEEAIMMALVLLAAGHETTANLVGNAMIALTDRPGLLRILRQSPEMVPRACEEFLRFDSPVQLASRIAKEDMRVSDVTVEAGSQALVCLGAANRDPAFFSSPDEIAIERSDRSHLSFGHGMHFCAGAALARAEAVEILSQLIVNVPDLEEREISFARGTSPTFRRVTELSVGRAG